MDDFEQAPSVTKNIGHRLSGSPLYVETNWLVLTIVVVRVVLAIGNMCLCAFEASRCAPKLEHQMIAQLVDVLISAVAIGSIPYHLNGLKMFEQHLPNIMTTHAPWLWRVVGLHRVERVEDLHSRKLTVVIVALFAYFPSTVLFYAYAEPKPGGIDLALIMKWSGLIASTWSAPLDILWSIAMCVPYLLSLQAVSTYLQHLQSLKAVPDWVAEVRAVHALDYALEQLWRGPCAVPWAMAFAKYAVNLIATVMEGVFALSQRQYVSCVILFTTMVSDLCFVLFFLYLLTLVSDQCVCKSASGKSILGAARAFELDMDDSQRLKYLQFMKYVHNNNMGIELFGVFVDFGLVSGLAVKAATVLLVLFGFIKTMALHDASANNTIKGSL